ncbi:MAG: hypothetical protein CM1200mP41_26070 [Gammaproteobacteria bacterium]|nr:MAG: hypothetical protein CM1200mP41_26070 [Gammaproteobacteria bacterium]
MSLLQWQQLNAQDTVFAAALANLLKRSRISEATVTQTVEEIIRRVREDGDSALIELTATLDHFSVDAAADLEISTGEIKKALATLDAGLKAALEQSVERIRVFHEHQLEQSWEYLDSDGNRLGQRVTPIDRVGIYVPGGTAAYPSSVLMNAVPASVAGVPEVVMVVPTPGGEASQTVLAAAALAGVTRVFRIGGAQAIAALCFGTETIPAVDKIVGPGNVYVAAAKQQVYGQVGVDMMAGPSEVVVLCDDRAEPDWVAMDLFAQAEHDELAQAILICPSQTQIDRIRGSMESLIGTLSRPDIVTGITCQAWRLDPGEFTETGSRNRQSNRPGTPTVDGRAAGRLVVGYSSCRRHFLWLFQCRSPRGLLCRAKSCVTYGGDRALFITPWYS